MIALILHFAQVLILGSTYFLSKDNTFSFFSIICCFIVELFTAKPIKSETKFICSKNMLSICKNALLTILILQHIENNYLHWLVLISGILKIAKNFTTVLVIKKIEQIIKFDYFIGIYTQTFSCYKLIHIGSYLFLTALFLQLELHTIVLEDQWKINSLVIANFSFFPFALLIILNLCETLTYIKWSLKKDTIQIKKTKKDKVQ